MDGELTAAGLRDHRSVEPDLRIIDVRAPESFSEGHIPGSENIPFGKLPAEIEQLDGAGRVVTVCPHGEASVQAARLIAAYEGVEGPVESLECGLEGWDGNLAAGEDASQQ